MKTYTNLWVVFALLIVGCAKSTDQVDEEKVSSVDADYTVLLQKGTQIEPQALNADYFSIALNTGSSPYSTVVNPLADFSEDNVHSFYRQTLDCKGEVISYDFNANEEVSIDVFPDLLDCNITVRAIASSNSYFYVAYEMTTATLQKEYVLRRIDNSSVAFSFVEIDLTQKPKQIVFSNNRIFVLTKDEGLTNKNNLSVIDNATFEKVHNQVLGDDVKNIFKKQDGNLIISYEELHAIVNVSTLAIDYVRYEDSTAPKFHDSNQFNFDDQGNLYYNRWSVGNSDISSIPAIYNLEANLAIFYYYENFLRTEQINMEYQIAETTVVSFDSKNGLMLIGYKKLGSNELGGLLRVKPAPDAAFIDNIDLDGVPYNIFAK